MTNLWPWLAVAGLGALHGLNPATGWALAAARSKHGPLAIALWSFMVSTAHGAGLMLVPALVPALVPLCLGDRPARALTASGSLGIALTAIGVHAAALLAVTGLVAAAACRGAETVARLRRLSAAPYKRIGSI